LRVNEPTKVLGHADREKPLRDYCAGLLATEGRRSVEPMAVVTDPDAFLRSIRSSCTLSPIPRDRMRRCSAKVREQVVPEMTRRGPIEVWIIDDTAFPKKGTHSVGVHHQSCGQLGKQANCQVAVTLSIANHHASLPIDYRLYLPREWADDKARRKKAHVPASIRFKTKPQTAGIRAPLLAGVSPGVGLQQQPAPGPHGIGGQLPGRLRLYALAQPAECPGRVVCSNCAEAALPALCVSSWHNFGANTPIAWARQLSRILRTKPGFRRADTAAGNAIASG
jgi:hypothetical protein